MKEIKLTQDKVALVDDEDYKWLNEFKWYCAAGYAARNSPKINGKQSINIFMHREINNTPKGMDTDHISHNRLDNRKVNLRTCTCSENGQNRIKNKKNNSGYKGVHYHKRRKSFVKPYSARIMVDKTHLHLGYYKIPEQAAKAYNKAALKYFGEFALLNKLEV